MLLCMSLLGLLMGDTLRTMSGDERSWGYPGGEKGRGCSGGDPTGLEPVCEAGTTAVAAAALRMVCVMLGTRGTVISRASAL